ncbi:6-carboxytetrahydropterin synthase [Phenylobacterium sp.]|uniref:6-pyruvoyl trahydropterin synthase family protein n=1 Tax=Phenylobacterium sp. TaxID=1871053 RepID=UPI0011F61F10|nr:6-carboxytetrahydropterin synthase [Phenylobacterium sp.]THD64367.1 MAG: 6-pyruvoyl tetrahydropterin synthase [Phenylobacterium sp.]
MVQLEFSRRYSMAHRLLHDADGKCLTPHGHNEVVTVTLRPKRDMDFGASNMAASFADLKRRWHAWIDEAVDHAFQVNAEDPLIDYFRAHEPERLSRLMVMRGDPTTEALAIAFLLKLSAFLAADGLPFEAVAVAIEETPTNRVSVTAEDWAASGAAWRPGDWASRADLSINDLELG